MPRNYTEKLEAEVDRLSRELALLRTQSESRTDSISPRNAFSTSNPSPQDGPDPLKSISLVVLEPSNETRFLGNSSGMNLARALLASVGCSVPNSPSTQHADNLEIRASDAMSSLPPMDYATQLVDIYFQYRTPTFPVMDRSDVLACVHSAYEAQRGDPTRSLTSRTRNDIFRTFVIFAIGLCGVHDRSGASQSAQSEGYFNSALQYLDMRTANSLNYMETLANTVLIAQYVALSPAKGNLWLLVGLAMRISVCLGVHWEDLTPSPVDCTFLNQRRRLWWATYWLDRLLMVTVGRPCGVEEQSVGARFPEPSSSDDTPLTDEHAQLAANHLVRLAQIDTEIKHVMYRQKIKYTYAFPQPNFTLWLAEIQPRLEEWRATIPEVQNAHSRSIYACKAWWDATYYNTVLLLYRPSPHIPRPSEESMGIFFEASRSLIICVQSLQREQKLGMHWVWVQRLFNAGLAFIYAVWHSDALRTSQPPEQVVNTLQICSNTLSVLAEKVPTASGCRDVFESLVTATVKALFAPMTRITGNSSHDAVESSHGGHLMETAEQHLGLEDNIRNMCSTLAEDMFSMGPTVGPSLDPATGWTEMADEAVIGMDPMLGLIGMSEWMPPEGDSQRFPNSMDLNQFDDQR